MAFLKTVRIRDYRSARDVELELGAVTALVGEARSGKSNLLRAVRALLDPDAPPPSREDLRGRADELSIEALLSDGRRIGLAAHPPAQPRIRRRGAPPVLFLPAARRSGPLLELDGYSDAAEDAVRRFRAALRDPPERRSDSAGASALVAGIDACCEAEITGAVLPRRGARALPAAPHAALPLPAPARPRRPPGTRCSTRPTPRRSSTSPGWRSSSSSATAPAGAPTIVQPKPLDADEAFRVVSEFDAERSELFLARAAILVEGRTEKLVLPSVFAALGHDADRAQISIVECGGKSNIPVFARTCKACRVPFVVVHDRDAPPGEQPIPAEIVLNRLIVEDRRPRADGRAGARLRGRHRPPRPREQARAGLGALRRRGRQRCPSPWSSPFAGRCEDGRALANCGEPATAVRPFADAGVLGAGPSSGEKEEAMKILLAYDGFTHSENALATAADLGHSPQAEITILSVVPPDARGSKSGGHVGLRPHAHEDVARAHAYLRERGIESTMQMEDGDPAARSRGSPTRAATT